MSTKPTDLARWADTGGAIVIPPSGKQNVGWVAGERPPAQFMNWLAHRNYLWNEYLRDGNISSLDENDVIRSFVDQYGYRAGQISEWAEHWKLATIPLDWTWTSTGASTNTYVDPVAGFPQRAAKINMTGVQGALQSLTSGYIAYMNADLNYVQEWDVMVTGTEKAVSVVSCGIQDANGGFYRFHHDAAGNWKAETHRTTGGNFDEDTGVAKVVDAAVRLKIALAGSSHHALGNYRARYYINGVLVIERGNCDNASAAIRTYLGHANATGAASLSIGRVKATWNHRLTQDAL